MPPRLLPSAPSAAPEANSYPPHAADSWGIAAIGFTLTKESFPLQLSGTAMGLVNVFAWLGVAILQAATQINDQTVAFAPKAIAIVVALVAAGPFMMSELTKFTHAIFAAVAKL